MPEGLNKPHRPPRRRSRKPLAALLSLLAMAAGLAWLLEPPEHPQVAMPAAAPPVAASVPAAEAAPPPPAPTLIGGPAHISLLAGDGTSGLRDGVAAQARFSDPYGLAAAPDGRLFIADGGEANRIRVLDIKRGQLSSLAGGEEGFQDGPSAQARFNTPSGLALDREGNLYIADTGNHAIRKLSPQGQVTTLAGDGKPGWKDGEGAQARFNAPLAVAVDAQGRVFVADTHNDRIRMITPEGQVSTLAGGNKPGEADGPGAKALFDTPSGLTLDANGLLWVADTQNHAIRSVDPASGEVQTWLRSPDEDDEALLRRPLSLAFTHDGVLLVGTMNKGGLLQVTPERQVFALTGGALRFSRPGGIAVDARGRVLVADAPAFRIHQVLPGEGESGPLGPALLQPPLETAKRWPLRPQQGWHEVVGLLGEVRGGRGKDRKLDSRHHLHAGLDIRGDTGEAVLTIADGKVLSPAASSGFARLGEGLAIGPLQYIHIRVGRDKFGKPLDAQRMSLVRNAAGKVERVRVARGTRFKAGEVIGFINPMAHVHLALGAPGFYRDAMSLGFEGFIDTVAPRIDSIELFDAAGKRLKRELAGALLLPRAPLQIVVDAWDQVDDNLERRRLGVQKLSWQLLNEDGTPLSGFEQPRETLNFEQLPVDDELGVKLAYAPASGITVHGARATQFRYQLANQVRDGKAVEGRWDPSGLPAGRYRLRVEVSDGNSNRAQRELVLRMD
ncbi:NHL repeat-containing protein [Pelomonas sp. SE-A7]|uniref:NHL repeat-containing protein n=1 Tax=Pelomonas sp. SE-A7 TaxID=3054953 RepID=UPI00259CC081|nr:NHL repeat-containing protein [Pelomonas sp. SE-A7]MDM4768071.1 NHL repeat-containing protein [Pelomonas sp. SE-A7]